MTQCLQDFIYASENFKGKSEKLAQSIEINSVLLADSSTEKAGQRNTILRNYAGRRHRQRKQGMLWRRQCRILKRNLRQ